MRAKKKVKTSIESEKQVLSIVEMPLSTIEIHQGSRDHFVLLDTEQRRQLARQVSKQ